MMCEHCGGHMPSEAKDRHGEGTGCVSCDLYNAAVTAQHAAAKRIASDFGADKNGQGAWLNEHGVFAYVKGRSVQVAPAEHAAPFVALTTAARAAARPKSLEPPPERTCHRACSCAENE